MMGFMRTMFGWPAEKRTVVNTSPSVEIKDHEHVKTAKAKLAALQDLLIRYRGTAHEEKIQQVCEKTHTIQQYLLAKDRVHELALFHIQQTDHFLATFNTIKDYHESEAKRPFDAQKAKSKAEVLRKIIEKDRAFKHREKLKVSEFIKPLHSQGQFPQTEVVRTAVPVFGVPEVSVNTYSMIKYLRENALRELHENEVGFTSTEEAKENFLQTICYRLGINTDEVAYFGNALVKIPNEDGSEPTGYVPILHWKGLMYALNLNDYRLFPVRIFRRSR